MPKELCMLMLDYELEEVTILLQVRNIMQW
jgi:hypothetical protein